MQHTIIFIKDR